jgi:serine/threonine-protein kinase
MGKLGYLSPEQCFGDPIDQRSDLFSMGTVLAEGLLGRRMFEQGGKESEHDVMRRIGEGPRPNFRALQPDLPVGLAQLLERALSIKPARRFQNAEAFRAGLADFLNPNVGNVLAIAALLRLLFKAEFEDSRLPGSPLRF